jgi:hypothetical protein
MKMKILLIMALMASLALATIQPNPIIVKITAGSPSVEVRQTNLRTGEVMSGYTDENGEFLAEWANSFYKYQVGDVFRIQVADYSKDITFTGMPIDVIYVDMLVPTTTTLTTTTTVTTIPVACDSCCSECPDATTPITEAAAVTYLAGLLTAGGYYKIYKSKAKKPKQPIKVTKKGVK